MSDFAHILDFARQATRRAAGGSRIQVITLPAPVLTPETVFADAAGDLAFLWAPPEGRAFAGAGAAARLQLAGNDRLGDLQTRAAELFARVDEVVHPACDVPPVRLFGGLAFAAGGARHEPWQDFGDGCFTLPRLLYTVDDGRASLSLSLVPDELECPDPWLEELEAMLRRLGRRAAEPAPQQAASFLVDEDRLPEPHVSADEVEHWHRIVRETRESVAAGRFDKVVLARRCEVELEPSLSVGTVLRHLARQMPTCTRFAFRRANGTFLGATPERLVSRRGRRLRTEALAGSSERGRERQLRASLKDRVEHSLVVGHITDRLAPFCRRLDWSEEPQVRELRDLLHLETPVEGELRSEVHVLELVAALHPTPAVGGLPVHEATSWIATHESHERGWYAGPIGWFDGRGDGEFSIALRSCMLEPRHAYLWAGGGIVADSDPEAEYAETELKLRAMLTALGAGQRGLPWTEPLGREAPEVREASVARR